MSLFKSTALLTSPLTSPTLLRTTAHSLQPSFPFPPTILVTPPVAHMSTTPGAVTPGGGPTSAYTLEALRSSLAALPLPGSLHLPPPGRRPLVRRLSSASNTATRLVNAGPLYTSSAATNLPSKPIALPRGRLTHDAFTSGNAASFASLHALLGEAASSHAAMRNGVNHTPATPHPTAAILPEGTPNVFFNGPVAEAPVTSATVDAAEGKKSKGRRASFQIDLPEPGLNERDTRNKGRVGTPFTAKGRDSNHRMDEWIGEEELVGAEGILIV